MLNFFDGSMFHMGDLTKVVTVQDLQVKKEVKLQKFSKSNIHQQQWTLDFERDRILGNSPSKACAPTPPTPLIPTPPTISIPNDVYPMYKLITTKEEYANYDNLWVLNNNVKGNDSDASEHDKKLYQELLKKYG